VKNFYMPIAASLLIAVSFYAGWQWRGDVPVQMKVAAENKQAKSTSQSQQVRTEVETKYQTVYRDVVKYVQNPDRTRCDFDDDYIRLREQSLNADSSVSRDAKRGVRVVESSSPKH